MDKLFTLHNKTVKYLLNPDFLKKALFVIIVLFIIYNAALFVRIMLKKFGILKEFEVREGEQSFFSKSKRNIRNISVGIIESYLIVNLVLLLGTGSAFAAFVSPLPRVTSPNQPSLEEITELTDKKPLIIKFDRPIDRKSLIKEISPELPGKWEFENISIGIESLRFTPDETPKAETRYTVSIKGIKSILGNKSGDYLFSFQTAPAPKVKSVTPKSGTQGIMPNQEIVVEADFEHENTADFAFDFSPAVSLEVKDEGKKHILKPKEPFKKGMDYNLKIFRTLTSVNFKTKEKKAVSDKAEIWTGNFRTIDAPGIKSYSPTGSGILTNNSIKIEFRQDMNKPSTEAAFSTNPKTTGNFSWEGNRILAFKPNSDLNKNTKYTVSLSKSAKAVDESPLEEDFSFNFTTIGYVTVSGFYPADRSNGVSTSSKISVTFNQAIDHASAESKFSVSPSLAGWVTWSGNTMTYNHNGLGYSTYYSINIATGVKTIYGLDSTQGFGAGFTTRSQSVTLNIPSYRQSHMYSCMASAARQALAYRGAYVSEDTILAQIGYDYTPFSGTWGDANSIWGDPDNGVTGNINGASGGVSWGYGAHAGPTSRAISNYRSNEVKSGWSVQGIAQEIAAGNPVIVYWVNGVWPAYTVYWKTSSGKTVRGVNSMHVQVVKGFTGTVDNPTSFVVNDSGYGYPSRTFDVGTFKAKWSWFGNTAIVVK